MLTFFHSWLYVLRRINKFEGWLWSGSQPNDLAKPSSNFYYQSSLPGQIRLWLSLRYIRRVARGSSPFPGPRITLFHFTIPDRYSRGRSPEEKHPDRVRVILWKWHSPIAGIALSMPPRSLAGTYPKRDSLWSISPAGSVHQCLFNFSWSICFNYRYEWRKRKKNGEPKKNQFKSTIEIEACIVINSRTQQSHPLWDRKWDCPIENSITYSMLHAWWRYYTFYWFRSTTWWARVFYFIFSLFSLFFTLRWFVDWICSIFFTNNILWMKSQWGGVRAAASDASNKRLRRWQPAPGRALLSLFSAITPSFGFCTFRNRSDEVCEWQSTRDETLLMGPLSDVRPFHLPRCLRYTLSMNRRLYDPVVKSTFHIFSRKKIQISNFTL